MATIKRRGPATTEFERIGTETSDADDNLETDITDTRTTELKTKGTHTAELNVKDTFTKELKMKGTRKAELKTTDTHTQRNL